MDARIYIADLAAYNNGKLHGRWIDVTDPDTMQEQITQMLAESPEPGAEEWAVHDYDGIPDAIADHLSIKALCTYAEASNGLNEYEAEAFVIWCSHEGHTCEEKDANALLEAFRDAYGGYYDTREYFAESVVESCDYLRDMPEHLHCYFDYDAFARDLLLTDYWEQGGHYFRYC